MKQYIEKQKRINVINNIDVAVVGGGPAGIAAAIGAAKAGASTMIIDINGAFGGMWTNGLVTTLAGFNSWLQPYRRCVNGIMGEWLRMAQAFNGAENNRSWVLNSDPEILKFTADQLMKKYNIKCLLHTLMVDVIITENQLQGILIENVDGRSAILAKNIVDCTGNGDVIARAKEQFTLNDELQPMTLGFFLAEVEPNGNIPFEDELVIPFGPEPGYLGEKLLMEYTSRRRDIYINRNMLKESYDKGKLPCFGGPWFGGMHKNFPWVNTTRIYGSAVNAQELTKAEMEARHDMHAIVEYYRKHCKGFEKSWIMSSGGTIGIRETRRLNGMYKLTKDDIISNRKFADSIALGVWPIDVHPPKGQNGMHDMYVPLPYHIPYRTLLPVKLDGLLVGGRCISTQREAMGSTRVGATCGATGHAAGVAAALSSILNIPPRKLNINQLQTELQRQNAIFE